MFNPIFLFLWFYVYCCTDSREEQTQTTLQNFKIDKYEMFGFVKTDEKLETWDRK